jgi:hypothetical protein
LEWAVYEYKKRKRYSFHLERKMRKKTSITDLGMG